MEWAYTYFTTELRDELEFLHFLFDADQCQEWSTPITQSVPREPHFKPSSDSSLEGLGAICHELRFLMRISLPADIMHRTWNWQQPCFCLQQFASQSCKTVIKIAPPGPLSSCSWIISQQKRISTRAQLDHQQRVRYFVY